MRGVAVRMLALLVGLGWLTGCGGDEDLAKVTFPRTEIPPGQQTTGANPGDAQRLSADGLRLVDPCSLLDIAVLKQFGTPDDNVGQNFDSCRNYMRDTRGEALSFSVLVGETLTNSDLEKATDQLADFKARVATVEGACFVTLVVEQVDPPVGVTLQTGYKAADPCEAAREVATSIGQRLRSSAALRTPRPGSLLGINPCTVAGSLPGEAVEGATDADSFGLHQCSWRNSGGAELELEFAYRFDPGQGDGEQRGIPVDLGGGVIGFEVRSNQSFPKCQLSWLHLLDAVDQGDVVEVEVRDVGNTGVDVCAAAITFGKGLVPKLPKP